MVENWEALKDESPGTVDVVVQMLRIVVYPKQEFVLTAGEMSDEMFFIVKGVVELKNRNHVSVAIL
jgi:signal-transduction protein with cAMP-binding, CBS, and nucleotidyltransferase domain